MSYERRAYESVDEKSLSYRLCPEKKNEKNDSGWKGLSERLEEKRITETNIHYMAG